MKLEFDRDQLSKILQQIGSIVEKKSTMPILGNALLEAKGKMLRVAATDLEIGLITECPVKVMVEGSVCVPARNLLEIVRELPDRVGKFSKGENDWVTIESGKAHFKMVGASVEKFPEMPTADPAKFMKIRTESFRLSIEKTFFAISTDEMRFNLNGAFLETAKDDKGRNITRMVATDGHRLALAEKELSDDETFTLKKGIILPRKGIAELRKLLAESAETFVGVSMSDANAVFKVGETTLFMRLVAGDFPDYRAVIPKGNKKRLMVQRDMFTQSLRRVSILSEGKSKCVKLGIKGGSVHLAANSPELGEAQEDVLGEFTGGELDIGFNARYLMDALTVAGGEKVLLELDAETSPGVVRGPDEPGFFSVIMPMRI